MNLKKIICTDDDPDIRNLISICLKDAGFIVELCQSGEETLKKIPLLKPDLIILDVNMPGMDGISILKSLHKDAAFTSIPVIFLTAKTGKHDIATLIKSGAVDVIVKPFEPFLFAEKIKEIWKKTIKP